MVECPCCGSSVPKCAWCGQMFAPLNRSDEKYCRRLAPGEPPGGRTCGQVGRQINYQRRLDDRRAAYRSTYQQLYRRVQRKNGKPLLDEWRHQAEALVAADSPPAGALKAELLRLADLLGVP